MWDTLRHAYLLPIVGAATAMFAIALCNIIAVGKGHLTVFYDGAKYRIILAPVSLTANHLPESALYGVAMVVAGLGFIWVIPSLRKLFHMIAKVWMMPAGTVVGGSRNGPVADRRSPPKKTLLMTPSHEASDTSSRDTTATVGGPIEWGPGGCGSRVVSSGFTVSWVLLFVACVGLVVQGVIPLQHDLLQRSVDATPSVSKVATPIKESESASHRHHPTEAYRQIDGAEERTVPTNSTNVSEERLGHATEEERSFQVYDSGSYLTLQSTVHLTSAGVLFAGSYLHGSIFVVILVSSYIRYSKLPKWRRNMTPIPITFSSALLKLAALASIPFADPLGRFVSMRITEAKEPHFVGSINSQGIGQRWSIFCIMGFVASYAVDLYHIARTERPSMGVDDSFAEGRERFVATGERNGIRCYDNEGEGRRGDHEAIAYI